MQAKLCTCGSSPLLRIALDSQALWSALRSGSLQVVSSDHSAYNFEGEGASKRMRAPSQSASHQQPAVARSDGASSDTEAPPLPFNKVPMGLPGLECRLPLLLSAGMRAGRMSVTDLVKVGCTNPARLYGLYPKKGTLHVGSDADLALWHLHDPRIITKGALHDDVDYTPYEGVKVRATAVLTMLRGKTLFSRPVPGRAGGTVEKIEATWGGGQWCACGSPDLLGWSPPKGSVWPDAGDAVLQHAEKYVQWEQTPGPGTTKRSRDEQ